MWETADPGETKQRSVWISAAGSLRRATIAAPGIVFDFLGFEPMALAIPSPNRTEKEHTLSAMWKPSQPEPSIPVSGPEAQRPAASVASVESTNRNAAPAGDQAVISKGLFVKGEISGTESLYIDGKVEGAINLPGNRVTIGRNGTVGANVTAREVVVMGKVRGNVSASDRVDIRAEGALSGDVSAARISIEDGAFFKGGIDIRKADAKPAQTLGTPSAAQVSMTAAPETQKPVQ
jgi:cytoskeletal protein CcmA (bactofilin family)